MSGFPEDFISDLRRLKSWPSMEGSSWRQPYLADLTYGEVHRLVDEFIVGQNLSVLEIGCGTGFLSLELAREGHNVIGIDSDEEAIDIATRTKNADPYQLERGNLEYRLSNIESWESAKQEYDLVVFSRALHHIPQPRKTLRQVHGVLNEKGRLVCIEFAYDQFDRRAAAWLYHVRRVLEQAGWYSSDRKLSSNADASIKQILDEWLELYEKKERLNRFGEMRKALDEIFREEHFSWEPYLYWYLIQHMRIPSNDVELAMARSFSALERVLIETKEIKPVLFCFVGVPR